MTNNMTRLRRAVDRVAFVPPSSYIGGGVLATAAAVPGTPPASGDNQRTAGSTALWDAVWITSDEILGPGAGKNTQGHHFADRRRRYFQQKKARRGYPGGA